MNRQLILIAFIFLLILSACEQETDTITYRFETNGGTQIEDIKIDKNESLNLPNPPSKEGYSFSGWYLDAMHFEIPYDIIYIETYMKNETIILYAKWEVNDTYYEITWQMPDGTIIKTDTILENTLPSYDGKTPYLDPTDHEIYTFTSWTPTIDLAIKDQVYTATFETTVIETSTFNPNDLNDLFGYQIYQFMPEIDSTSYEIFDYSEDAYKEIYIDVFDWSLEDSIDYMDKLDLSLDYAEQEDAWILDHYYIYVYEDTFSYPNETVFGICIYGEQKNHSYYDSFNSVIDFISTHFNDLTLKSEIPDFLYVDELFLLNSQSSKIEFTGLYTGDQQITDQNNWINLLIINGFTFNQDLSTQIGQNVFSKAITNDLSYGIVFTIIDTSFYFSVWSYDPTVELNTLEQLDVMQSIHQYELSKYNISGLPSIGTFDVLVIPIEFSEQPFPSDYLEKLDLVFNGTAEDTGWQSVSSFHQLSSYGLLNLNFDIVEKHESSLTKSFIENMGGNGDQYAISSALESLNPTIDYSKYDTNQDGYIDSIYFIYSVDFDYDTDPWWAWVYAAKYGEASRLPKLDGLYFEYYAWISYHFLNDPIGGSDGQIVNAETFIHETGHLFGGVDLYAYSNDYGPLGGMGMMDFTSGDHDPIHKLLFGWLKPYLASTGTYEVTLESYALDDDGVGSTLIIPYNYTSLKDGDAFDEFIIVMFYTPDGLYSEHIGLDYVLDQPGLMVYHVDARLNQHADFWEPYFIFDNDSTSKVFARLLEVDLNNSLSSNFISLNDILTQGSIDLSHYQWHQGGSIEITIDLITLIQEHSDSVTFNLTVQ